MNFSLSGFSNATIAWLSALLAVQAFAQDTATVNTIDLEPQTQSQIADETVVVRGQRLSEIEFDLPRYVIEFIEEAAAPARGRGFARWHRNFCVGVHNLAEEPAQYIVDRISALALDVGLEVGEPGCNPDSIIVFSTNAEQTASMMVESEPRVFRPAGGESGMELGFEGLDNFVATDRAVRWWHVSLPVDARHRQAAIELPNSNCIKGIHCFPWIGVLGPSRIHSGIVDELKYVIIIVDATKLPGTSWGQLADYLALVSLAQINPQADPQSFDSILNLFTNPAAYSGLTDWDESYLQSLYAFDQRRVLRLQRNEIVSQIVKQEQSLSENTSSD